MNGVIGLLAIAVTASFLAVVLYSYKPEFSVIIAVCAGVYLLSKSAQLLSSVMSDVKLFFQKSNISGDIEKTVFKALGICCITGITADVCRDMGQSALASGAELIGKCAIAVLCFPLLRLIAETASALIGEI